MKKIALFGLCLAVAASASAQTSLVKEAEREAKAKNYEKAMTMIEPAFSNPETSGYAFTYFVPGKAGIDMYTDLYAQTLIGKQVDKKKMGHALIDGFGYLIKALPLDSVPDAKGKIKPKYSKNIVKMIDENHKFLYDAGVALFMDAKDYQGAYDAWELYSTLPDNPALGKNAPKALPDTIIADVFYNQALAAWQLENLELSLASFEKAIAKGYDKPQAYDYAINHAARLGKNEKVYELANIAYDKFGNANPLYLQLKINGLIDNKKYDEAAEFLNNAIAEKPEESQLYLIQGILYETLKDNVKAKQSYLTATQKDEENADALYNYARLLCNEAYALNDEAQNKNLSNAEFTELRTSKIDPLFKTASEYLEKALAINPDNRDVRTYLRNVYYNLGDEENLKRIENM